MNAPQVIVVSLYTLSVGIAIVKHGEPSENNAWNTIISVAIMSTLLIWGGFFQ